MMRTNLIDTVLDRSVVLGHTRIGDGTQRFWHDRRLRPTSFARDPDHDPAPRRRLWNYIAQATSTAPWIQGPG